MHGGAGRRCWPRCITSKHPCTAGPRGYINIYAAHDLSCKNAKFTMKLSRCAEKVW